MRALYHLIKACRLQAFFLFFVILIQSVAPALNLFATTNIITSLVAGEDISLIWLCFWAITLLIGQIMKPLEIYFRGNVTELSTQYFNLHILDTTNAIDNLAFFDNKEHFETIEFLRKEASYRPLNFVVTISYVLRSLFTLISIVLVLMQFSFLLALVMIISSIPLFLTNIKVEARQWKALLQTTKEAMVMKYVLQSATDEHNLQEIRSFNTQSYWHKKYEQASKTLHCNLKKTRLKALITPIPFIIINLLALVVALYYFVKTSNHTMQVTALVIGFQSLILLRDHLSNLLEMLSNLYSLHKFFTLFDRFIIHHQASKTTGKMLLSQESYAIHLLDVNFCYPNLENSLILKNINLKIAKGEKVAIVGSNGSGKTTLMKLLLKFYEPTSGDIFIENCKLKDIDTISLRSQISLISQHFGKYHTSVIENVIFKENHSSDECEAVQKILDFVEFNKPLHQKLGKEFDGETLSGGMWQKLALSRALYKKSGVYLLDEFSSALDPLIERKIFQHLLSEKATLIAITHHLYNLKDFDTIVVLEKGEIVEKGCFDFLMNQKGRFYKMYSSQVST